MISKSQHQILLTLLITLMTSQGCGEIASTVPSPAVPTLTKTPSLSLPTPTTVAPFSSPVPLTKAVIDSCPVTIPNGSVPPYEQPASIHHGNGSLWTVIPNWGKTWVAPRYVLADVSISIKWGWWRGVRGKLTVEGRRLDATAPPAQGYYDTPGYGDEGFQAGGILFPSEGCWEITGRVGDASLTFVTLVVKVPFQPAWPGWLPEGMINTDVDITALPKSLRFSFGSSIGDKGEISFETTQGLPNNPTSYPDTARQQVTVNGQPGACVQGAWDKQGKWKANVDAGALEWSANGLSYRISHSGLKLRCEDLLRMAGSSP